MIVDYFADGPEVLEVFVPEPGQTVVDVGAHVGAYTILSAKRVGEVGKVIAIEAHPDNYKVLLKNLMLNGLRNVIPVNIAVSDCEGYLRLYSGKDAEIRPSGWHSTIPNHVYVCRDSYLVVPCTKLDSLLTKIGVEDIDWIKMDVEGAELSVLKGAKNTLITSRQLRIVLEVHTNYREVISFLKNLGFNISTVSVHKDGREHILAIKEELIKSNMHQPL
ncbi:MAG: FkbM family methyltransferase [Candidatus Nezhaarchaeota archaeon]|nr:FkbM family methyltransferase [Candidatus Nezhaarchaeota archaeon]